MPCKGEQATSGCQRPKARAWETTGSLKEAPRSIKEGDTVLPSTCCPEASPTMWLLLGNLGTSVTASPTGHWGREAADFRSHGLKGEPPLTGFLQGPGSGSPELIGEARAMVAQRQPEAGILEKIPQETEDALL